VPALKGRKKNFVLRHPSERLDPRILPRSPFLSPLQGEFVLLMNPGLKPRAESYCPFGTKARVRLSPMVPSSFVILNYGGQVGTKSAIQPNNCQETDANPIGRRYRKEGVQRRGPTCFRLNLGLPIY
jgi:hypothetical protein